MSISPIPVEFAPLTPGAKVTDVRYVRDAGARVATVAALRADATLPDRAGGVVHLECHTQAGLGGGDLVWGAYGADDNGFCFRVTGRTDGAWRRSGDPTITPYLFGGGGDFAPGQTAGTYDRTKDTGGLRDNTAIIEAILYGRSQRKPVVLPSGMWLIDHTPLTLQYHDRLWGEHYSSSILYAKIDAPVAIYQYNSSYAEGVHVEHFELTNVAIATYETGFLRAIDLYGSTHSKLDVAFGGTWAVCLDSRKSTLAPEVFSPRGHNYFPDFTLRDFPYSGSETYARFGNPVTGFRDTIRVEAGGLTAGVVRLKMILLTGIAAIVERGIGWSVETQTEGSEAPYETPMSLSGKDAIGVYVPSGYSEGCTESVVLEDCYLVKISGQNTAPIRLVRCKGVILDPQTTNVELEDCTGVVNLGSMNRQAGYQSALQTNNVDVVSLGLDLNPGQAGVYTVGYSQQDSGNLLINGDLRRWVGALPWGWTLHSERGAVVTKCGTGLTDTRAPTGALYSARIQGYLISFARLTAPLGQQYANTTLSVSCKVYFNGAPLTVGQLAFRAVPRTTYQTPLGIYPALTGQCMALTGADAGWYLVSQALLLPSAILATGVDLQIDGGPATDLYVADLDVRLGTACQRRPSHPQITTDGAVTLDGAGHLRWSAAATAEVDPWSGQAVINGDRIELLEPSAGGALGWVRVAGAWKAFGSVAP
jgi:hypothetical protein